jgi:hypothetical protein
MKQFVYLALDVPLLKSKIQRFQKKILKRVIGARGVFFDLRFTGYDIRVKIYDLRPEAKPNRAKRLSYISLYDLYGLKKSK